jgi:DNA-binding MarR family transcriptional regulator
MPNKTALKLWLQLARTSAILQNEINTRFRTRYGQSMTRFDVMSQLARAGDNALGVSALSASLIASSGNITRLLDRMQNEGLVHRQPAPNDRRGIIIQLTGKGQQLFAQMAISHEQWITTLLKKAPKAEQQVLLNALVDLQATLSRKP